MEIILLTKIKDMPRRKSQKDMHRKKSQKVRIYVKNKWMPILNKDILQTLEERYNKDKANSLIFVLGMQDCCEEYFGRLPQNYNKIIKWNTKDNVFKDYIQKSKNLYWHMCAKRYIGSGLPNNLTPKQLSMLVTKKCNYGTDIDMCNIVDIVKKSRGMLCKLAVESMLIWFDCVEKNTWSTMVKMKLVDLPNNVPVVLNKTDKQQLGQITSIVQTALLENKSNKNKVVQLEEIKHKHAITKNDIEHVKQLLKPIKDTTILETADEVLNNITDSVDEQLEKQLEEVPFINELEEVPLRNAIEQRNQTYNIPALRKMNTIDQIPVIEKFQIKNPTLRKIKEEDQIKMTSPPKSRNEQFNPYDFSSPPKKRMSVTSPMMSSPLRKESVKGIRRIPSMMNENEDFRPLDASSSMMSLSTQPRRGSVKGMTRIPSMMSENEDFRPLDASSSMMSYPFPPQLSTRRGSVKGMNRIPSMRMPDLTSYTFDQSQPTEMMIAQRLPNLWDTEKMTSGNKRKPIKKEFKPTKPDQEYSPIIELPNYNFVIDGSKLDQLQALDYLVNRLRKYAQHIDKRLLNRLIKVKNEIINGDNKMELSVQLKLILEKLKRDEHKYNKEIQIIINQLRQLKF